MSFIKLGKHCSAFSTSNNSEDILPRKLHPAALDAASPTVTEKDDDEPMPEYRVFIDSSLRGVAQVSFRYLATCYECVFLVSCNVHAYMYTMSRMER